MTGLKILACSLIAGLYGIIQSEHVDAWAKLAAVPILGAVILALIWLQWKTVTAHRDGCESIASEIGQIRVDQKEHQDTQIELLREALKR